VFDLSLNKDGEPKDSISVDDIRILASDIYTRPFIFDRKIYIVNNADKMTPQAQNALLKAFEEPPPYVVIILIAAGISNILPTIQSRGAVLRFNPLPPDVLRQYLRARGEKYSDDVIENAVLSADGSVAGALAIVNSENYNELKQETTAAFLRLLSGKNKSDVTKMYEIFIKNEENVHFILDIMSNLVYDIINRDNKSLLKNKNINYPDINPKNSYEIFKAITGLLRKLSTNAAYNLSVFAALLEIHGLCG
jgi:DNA polymerase-3 subunit delta'